jgi:hypothetical protein
LSAAVTFQRLADQGEILRILSWLVRHKALPAASPARRSECAIARGMEILLFEALQFSASTALRSCGAISMSRGGACFASLSQNARIELGICR